MASSRNGSGMKILWIPGRKRHDRKGIYKPTNKEVNKNYIQQRKNEMWTLGGSHEQRKLINISVHDEAGGSTICNIATGTHIVDPLCLAAGSAAAANAIKDNQSDDKANLDENSTEKEKIVDKDILKNGEMNGDAKACNTDNIDIEDHAYHNSGTIRFKNKKTGSNNTDLDSIEHLDFDEEEGKKKDFIDDDIDSVSMQRMRSANTSSYRRRKAKKKNKKIENEKKKGEKIVDCLYVGLMCCECTIS